MTAKNNPSKGFTLIELLIVIAIIGCLAAAILVAVDPVKRIQDARNSKRWSEVNGVLNAILTKQVDDRRLFTGTAGTPVVASIDGVQVIVRTAPPGSACTTSGNKPLCPGQTLSDLGVACVADLSDLKTGGFIAELPLDPTTETIATGPGIGDNNTGYFIHATSNGRVEIGSCWPDQSAVISVKR